MRCTDSAAAAAAAQADIGTIPVSACSYCGEDSTGAAACLAAGRQAGWQGRETGGSARWLMSAGRVITAASSHGLHSGHHLSVNKDSQGHTHTHTHTTKVSSRLTLEICYKAR